jgi:purine nucleosidase
MRSVILDTDPGVDDLFAILMALGSRSLNVSAITTVAGNVGLAQTTRNALRILAMAGKTSVPVYAGESESMSRPVVSAAHVHGDDGIHNAPLPEPVADPQTMGAVEFLVSCDVAELICIGPLTNVARALQVDPSLARRIMRITAMAGAFGTYTFAGGNGPVHSSGNVTAVAEFNIYFDPIAADIVLRSGVPVTMIPLDVTHRALVTAGRLERIAAIPRIGCMLAHTLDGYGEFSRSRWGTAAGPLHDPVAVGFVEDPQLCSTHRGTIEVDTGTGQTRFTEHADGPHEVAFDLDDSGFFSALLINLEALT